MKETLVAIASLFGLLAGSVGLVTGAALLYSWFKRKEQGYPNEAIIEAAILPYIQKAILAAYKASEAVMDETGERLHGIDKARLAGLVYAMLPAYLSINVGGYEVRIPIKQMFPQERFEDLVEKVFNDFLVWYGEKFDEWGDLIQDELDAVVAARTA